MVPSGVKHAFWLPCISFLTCGGIHFSASWSFFGLMKHVVRWRSNNNIILLLMITILLLLLLLLFLLLLLVMIIIIIITTTTLFVRVSSFSSY